MSAPRTDRPVVASGGVSTLDDLRAMATLESIGVEGAIVGKALYAGAFTLRRGPGRAGVGMIERFGSGGPWEQAYGYSRVVRAGDVLLTAGCTATVDGVVTGVGDPYAQTLTAFRIGLDALAAAGATIHDVLRTRMYVVLSADADAVGRAHGERSARSVRCRRWSSWPACCIPTTWSRWRWRRTRSAGRDRGGQSMRNTATRSAAAANSSGSARLTRPSRAKNMTPPGISVGTPASRRAAAPDP